MHHRVRLPPGVPRPPVGPCRASHRLGAAGLAKTAHRRRRCRASCCSGRSGPYFQTPHLCAHPSGHWLGCSQRRSRWRQSPVQRAVGGRLARLDLLRQRPARRQRARQAREELPRPQRSSVGSSRAPASRSPTDTHVYTHVARVHVKRRAREILYLTHAARAARAR